MDESQKAGLTQLILETAREHGAKVENLDELEELLTKTNTDEGLLSLVRELHQDADQGFGIVRGGGWAARWLPMVGATAPTSWVSALWFDSRLPDRSKCPLAFAPTGRILLIGAESQIRASELF